MSKPVRHAGAPGKSQLLALAVPAVGVNACSSLCSTGSVCRLVDSLECSLHAVSILLNNDVCAFVFLLLVRCFWSDAWDVVVGC